MIYLVYAAIGLIVGGCMIVSLRRSPQERIDDMTDHDE